MAKLNNVNELKDLRAKLKEETFTACTATGAHKLINRFEKESANSGVDLEIVKTGCQGICQKGPVLKVEPMNIFYQRTKPKNVPWIMNYSMLGNMPYRQGLYRDDIHSEPIAEMNEIPFYKKQKRLALRNNGIVDPCNINHYLAAGRGA